MHGRPLASGSVCGEATRGDCYDRRNKEYEDSSASQGLENFLRSLEAVLDLADEAQRRGLTVPHRSGLPRILSPFLEGRCPVPVFLRRRRRPSLLPGREGGGGRGAVRRGGAPVGGGGSDERRQVREG